MKDRPTSTSDLRPTPQPRPEPPDLGSELGAWLSAERQAFDPADPGRAEEALFGLFEALPVPTPRPGFADRVLVASGWVPGAVGLAPALGRLPAVRDLDQRARLLTAVACGLMALAAMVMMPVSLVLLLELEPAAVLATGARAFSASLRFLVELVQVGQALTGLGRAVWLVATSPQVLAGLCILGVTTLAISRGLLRLIQSERIPSHVRAH